MKFKQLYLFLNTFFINNSQFFFIFTNKILNKITTTFLFNWKISNYSDSYWFLYSNKKSMNELKYLIK